MERAAPLGLAASGPEIKKRMGNRRWIAAPIEMTEENLAFRASLVCGQISCLGRRLLGPQIAFCRNTSILLK
jgi:hypothetical protein